jgi:hypothetical protein
MAINKLTDTTFRNTKPSTAEQILSDGGGLYVRVRPMEEGVSGLSGVNIKPFKAIKRSA